VTTVHHTYRTACTTVRQPPGFGDFLRGSIALAILSLEKGFSLRLDFTHHPIGRFLREQRPSGAAPQQVVEFFNDRAALLPSFLDGLDPGASVAVTTNASPDMRLLTDEVRALVLPQLAFDDVIDSAAASLARTIHDGDFAILHVRVADGVATVGADERRGLIRYVKHHIMPKWGSRLAVVSNATSLKKELSDSCGLPFIDTGAVHLGECSGTEADVRDTLIDFALLSRAGEIFSWSNYAWTSGFSTWCACLHGIPFVHVRLQPTLGERLGRAVRTRLRPVAAALGLTRRT